MSKTVTEELTKQELQIKVFDAILAKSILANQHALNQNDMLKGSKYYKGSIKKSGRELTTALINSEAKEFYEVMKIDATRVVETYKDLDKALNTLAKCVFVCYEDVDLVLRALAKDRKSMIGIANKVL